MVAFVAGVLAAPASADPGDGRLGGSKSSAPASTSCAAGVGANGVSGSRGTISVFTVVATGVTFVIYNTSGLRYVTIMD